MKLPLNVIQGHLGSLTLQFVILCLLLYFSLPNEILDRIPWSNLKGKPVKVLIEDVYLLAAPKADQEVSPTDHYDSIGKF